MIAPKKQFVVSIILAVLGVLNRGGFLFLMNIDYKSFSSLELWYLPALAGGVGAFFVYRKVRE